jgi:hypothetical protein
VSPSAWLSGICRLLLTGRGRFCRGRGSHYLAVREAIGDSAADELLRFGRSPFWASGLTDFNRALRIACVRCCNRQVLWPRRYLPKLADRLCRHADVLVYLNSHRGWKATESNLEGRNASWFVPHSGFSRFGFSAKRRRVRFSSEGSQSQPAPGAPRSLREPISVDIAEEPTWRPMLSGPDQRIGASHRRPIGNQPTCRRYKTPALPLEWPNRSSSFVALKASLCCQSHIAAADTSTMEVDRHLFRPCTRRLH